MILVGFLSFILILRDVLVLFYMILGIASFRMKLDPSPYHALQTENRFQFYVDESSEVVHELETCIGIYLDAGFMFHFENATHIYVDVSF